MWVGKLAVVAVLYIAYIGDRKGPALRPAGRPVGYSHPDDAWIALATFRLPRDEATRVWVALQQTSTRLSDRQDT